MPGHGRSLLLNLAVLLCAGTLCALGFRRVEVLGDSMAPTLMPGDRLVVVRLPAFWPLRPGDLVACRDPREPATRVLVKRVSALSALGVMVEGDNRAASTDSRTFGELPRSLVVGRVLYRYGPSERAGTVA
jgi:nickel-type superoxide dismutase maturation protease